MAVDGNGVDRQKAERALAEFLRALGHDPSASPELAETPARVTQAFADELLAGYSVNVPELCAGGSPVRGDPGLVSVRNISVTSVCPHHLMPASGSASIVYAPHQRLLGLGTLAALVDAHARRLTLQEAIGAAVVQALVDHAGAKGAYCELTLVHSCLSARGARATHASVRTVSVSGSLAEPEGQALLALALGAREGT